MATKKSTYKLRGTTFEVDERYHLQRKIGQGAFGTLCEALDTQSGERVAVKKIANALEDDVQDMKRTLREIVRRLH